MSRLTGRLAISLMLSVMAVGCAHTKKPDAPRPALADNPLLAELAAEDQAYRMGKNIARSDEDRVRLVLAELGTGRVATPADRFAAALVLQHTPLTIRDNEIAAVSPDNYLLAHYLAKSAFDSGYERARTLVAQTIDRYLSLTEGYQKYGTNRFINQVTGREELSPVDRNTPDSERAVYGVAPLAELLKKFPEATRKPKQ